MTYGRRHYITQVVLAHLAYSGPRLTTLGDGTRDFARALLQFVLTMTIAFGALLGLANAQTPTVPALQPGDSTSGAFVYRSDAGGQTGVAPLVNTAVQINVTGVIARATVTQKFLNPTDAWVEGTYVFPLPEGSAVDHLKMKVGERQIEGQIREKEQARLEFQQAAAAGQRATMVEQQRPNLFTTRVTNLGPHETLEVEIEYQEALRLDGDHVRLRFPLAITPRYQAAMTEALSELENVCDECEACEGCGEEEEFDCDDGDEGDTDEVPVTSVVPPTIQVPYLPRGLEFRNPVTIEVNLAAGFDVAALESPSHTLVVDERSVREFSARLRDSVVPADRDFQLTWRAAPAQTPQASVTVERWAAPTEPDASLYSLVTLFPPVGASAQQGRSPREAIFVIDTSGSMAGASMEQAKAALVTALGRLAPIDRFNVIQFNSFTSSLFEGTVPATSVNLERGMSYVKGLNSGGGTEMFGALTAALQQPARAGLTRQIIFVTDGAVDNEDQLFGLIHRGLGASRLFTVGIGSAPNSHFMTKVAEFGRGTFTFIGNVEEVASKMGDLFAKIESPVLQDVSIEFVGVGADRVESWPKRIPDLYLGEPLVVAARLGGVPRQARVRGTLNGNPYESVVDLDNGEEAGGAIHVLWARRKVQALLDGAIEGADPEATRTEVISLGLAHHLVTRYTSLIAVDVTPVRPGHEPLVDRNVPVARPTAALGDSLPQTATPATVLALIGFALWIASVGVYVVSRVGAVS